MTKFYLITGFLGAGKTTFMKAFLPLLAPQRIHLIINEFGREGVDGTLLSQVGAVLDEINNGSIFCACRLDKFEEVLAGALAQTPDVIVAEASGLADPTNVRRVLAQFPQVDYQGAICLVDALRLPRVYDTALVTQRQLAVSSLVLLNKTDLATPQQQSDCQALITQSSPAAHVIATQFGHIEADWLSFLSPNLDVEAAATRRDITLQKVLLEVSPLMEVSALEKCLIQLGDCTHRMKGLLTLAEGTFLADCTGPDIQLKPWQGETNNQLILLAGKGMPLRRGVKQALQWYGAFLSLRSEP